MITSGIHKGYISFSYIQKIKKLLTTREGSFLLYCGRVRDDFYPKYGKVMGIQYEVYQEMAEKRLQEIEKHIKQEFSLSFLLIRHARGYVPVGKIAFFVALSSPHSQESLEALPKVIHMVKHKVPIWKKEIFSSGKTRWVKGRRIEK